jgi:hypothetical protein
LGQICFLRFKNVFEKIYLFIYFFFASNLFIFGVLDHFDVVILKIIFKK